METFVAFVSQCIIQAPGLSALWESFEIISIIYSNIT